MNLQACNAADGCKKLSLLELRMMDLKLPISSVQQENRGFDPSFVPSSQQVLLRFGGENRADAIARGFKMQHLSSCASSSDARSSFGSLTGSRFGEERSSIKSQQFIDGPTTLLGSRSGFSTGARTSKRVWLENPSFAQSSYARGLSPSLSNMTPESERVSRQEESLHGGNDDNQQRSGRQYRSLDERNSVEILNRIQAIGGANQLAMLFRVVNSSTPSTLTGTVLRMCDAGEDDETASLAVALSIMCSDPSINIISRLCKQFSEYFDFSCCPSVRRTIVSEFGSSVSDALLARVERFFRLSSEQLDVRSTRVGQALTTMTSRRRACSHPDLIESISGMIDEPIDVSCYLRDGSDFLTTWILVIFICMAVRRPTTKPQRLTNTFSAENRGDGPPSHSFSSSNRARNGRIFEECKQNAPKNSFGSDGGHHVVTSEEERSSREFSCAISGIQGPCWTSRVPMLKRLDASIEKFCGSNRNIYMQVKNSVCGLGNLITPGNLENAVRIISEALLNVQQLGNDAFCIGMYEFALERVVGDVHSLLQPNEAEVSCGGLIRGERERVYTIAIAIQKISKIVGLDRVSRFTFSILNDRCPWTRPEFITRTSNEPDESFYNRQGRLRTEQGYEPDTRYVDRMSGLFSLFSAMTQVDDTVPEFGYELAWEWLSQALNSAPHPDTAYAVGTFLEYSGYSLSHVFKRQMRKLIDTIQTELLPILRGKCRLDAHEFFLHNQLQLLSQPLDRITPPEGRNPSGSSSSSQILGLSDDDDDDEY